MSNFSPQQENDSPAQWASSVTHIPSSDNGLQYVRAQSNSSGSGDSEAPNNTNNSFQRQAEHQGSVITRMAPYGASWSYSLGPEHIRIPVAPESLGYSTQPAYPSSSQAEPQRMGPPPRVWSSHIKDEPEDLTGRQRSNKPPPGLPNTSHRIGHAILDSASESDSDLCIDEDSVNGQRDSSGVQKRKKVVVPPGVLSSVTTAELQKRPGLIPLTSNLAGPVQVMTAKDGAKLYSCPECNLFYADHLAFEIHLQAHGVTVGKRHICKECGTSFRRREHLDAHMTAHSQDRPYSCETCGRAFKRNEHLTRHRILHSGDKQHVCSDCGKSFFRKDHLMKHSQTHILRKLATGEG